MAKASRKLNVDPVSRLSRIAIFAAWLLAFSAGLCTAGETTDTVENDEPTTPLPPPVVMSDFTVYIMKGNDLREEVTAREARLYQSINIAHLYRIHVDFITTGSEQQDTLDAPEGYLYLNDVTLTPEHPFYRKIGGTDAITTATFFFGGKAEDVWRAARDIDLIGTAARPVIYRRTDGTTVTCHKAYRSAVESRLYGLGDCRLEGKMNLSGQRVTVDDKLTSTIRVLGSPRALGTE